MALLVLPLYMEYSRFLSEDTRCKAYFFCRILRRINYEQDRFSEHISKATL